MEFVNLNKQYQAYKKEIDHAIDAVLKQGDFILGNEVANFEEDFRNYTKAAYAIACANGTDALHLALRVHNIGQGDEVIVPDFTFIATASMTALVGATPVFADINPETFTIDPLDVKRKITKNTKAIITVHLFGYPSAIAELQSICKKHKIFLIEDCAQAFGAKYKNQHVGTYGSCGCFSFFPAKNLGAYGDGGLITTNNKEIYEKLRMLRSHGARTKYNSELIGINSRLDTVQAAILRVKLRHFEKELIQRQQFADYYNNHLKSFSIIQKPFSKTEYQHSWNYYTLRVKNREQLAKHLKEKNIPAMIYYPVPLHQQQVFGYRNYHKGDFPKSEQVTNEVLSLPLSAFMTEQELEEVVTSINGFTNQ